MQKVNLKMKKRITIFENGEKEEEGRREEDEEEMGI